MILAKSFPFLIEKLCREYHDDNLLAMQAKAKVGYTTLWRWLRGTADTYRPDTIQKLVRAYRLDLREVLAVIQRDEVLRFEGKPVPVPDLTWVKRGPKFLSPKRRRHVVAGMVLLALTTGGVPASAGTMAAERATDNILIIGSCRRRHWYVPAWSRTPIAA